MFFLPNYNALDDAKKARARVRPRARRLHRPRRPGTATTAPASGRRWRPPPRSATPGSSPGSREELTRSRWSGLPPWDALHALADELGLPELDDFADIMRLSGEEGAPVYTNLRARSAAMRTAMLNDEIAEANAVGERMTIPGSLLGVIFMALLVAPSLLRMFSDT